MTTNAFAHITTADIEYVPVTSIAVNDVLVSNAHTRKQHANELPTARKLATATFIIVATIAPSGRLIDINADDASNRVTALNTINVWRVKRGA